MSKPTTVSFRLHAVELLESCINQLPEGNRINVVFQFDINVETKFRAEDHLLIAICQVNVSDQETKQLLGSVKTAVAFFIENWADYYEPKTNTLSLPNEANVTFNSIAISTTRGIMFSFFRGTFLHNAFLPIVDPKGFEIRNL